MATSQREFKQDSNLPTYRGYPRMDLYNYLSVHLDYKANLNGHINLLKEKTFELKRNLRILGKANFKVRTWILLWKAYILPHFAYSAIAANSAKAKTPMKNLCAMVRKNFKEFMGLKKTISNQLNQAHRLRF